MTTLTTPTVARSRAELSGLRGVGQVAFVPTMGALHEGHATLLRAARERVGAEGTVVLSIFVNPLQFGPGEDLDRYPRTFDADLEIAAREGVDVVFAPVIDEMYPDGVPHEVSTSSTTGEASSTTGEASSTTGEASSTTGEASSTTGGEASSTTGEARSTTGEASSTTGGEASSTGGEASSTGGGNSVTVHPGALADILDGASRPGHFRGVLTVVAKLFGLVRPDVAIFGEKDYQQLVLIRRMVNDLCLGIEIVGAPTDREPDGLARSSRNRYLDAEQRRVAATLSRALRAAQERAAYGVPVARWAAMSVLTSEPGVELDYLALTSVDLDPLPDHPEAGTEGRILVAARVGSTRLIDNMPLHFDTNNTHRSTDLNTGSTAPAAGTTNTNGGN